MKSQVKVTSHLLTPLGGDYVIVEPEAPNSIFTLAPLT